MALRGHKITLLNGLPSLSLGSPAFWSSVRETGGVVVLVDNAEDNSIARGIRKINMKGI